MDLIYLLQQFIDSHHLQESRILVGLSGGADSIALMYSLLACRRRFPQLKIGVAHIDHRWREESSKEAAILKAWADSWEVQWYLSTLDPTKMQGNLEDACRQARLDFFNRLAETYSYEGVMLAHHADDQAETVLKRLLEGGSWLSLQGMQEACLRGQLLVWRPFLSVRKKDILNWIHQKNLMYFEDSTNQNTKYLRARMRAAILPALSQTFGKDVVGPLCRIGSDIQDIDHYFQGLIQPYLAQIIVGEKGLFLHLESAASLHFCVVKYILVSLLKQQHLYLSHQQLTQATQALIQGDANKLFEISLKQIWIDRKYIFILNQKKIQKKLGLKIPLKLGCVQWDEWCISVSLGDEKQKGLITNWRNLWQEGKATLFLKAGSYEIGDFCSSALYLPVRKEIGKWCTEKKVPSFIRDWVPVIWQDQAIVGQFLSEQLVESNLENCWRVDICRNHRRH